MGRTGILMGAERAVARWTVQRSIAMRMGMRVRGIRTCMSEAGDARPRGSWLNKQVPERKRLGRVSGEPLWMAC